MVFPTVQFLLFFILVYGVFRLLPGVVSRQRWLLVASLFFYMAWNPAFILLVAFSVIVDYIAALRISSGVGAHSGAPLPRTAAAKGWLIFSLVSNLGLLAWFKYANFLSGSTFAVLRWCGMDLQAPAWDIMLPVGISFYTFQSLSYTIDVWRGRLEPCRKLEDFAFFVLFFPQLVAGPIVRAAEFLPQMGRAYVFDSQRFRLGALYFLQGLIKKCVIADQCAVLVDMYFANSEAYGCQTAWLAALLFTVQIYGDFSGYSDMAVGLGHMFGYQFPENFRLPYLAASITEFWRRWHMSLSSWLRDYLYIPLGGNRGGTLATYRNLLLTMLLGGLWHGASWTFVAWGAFHGVLLAGHRLFSGSTAPGDKGASPFSWLLTQLLVLHGWVLFRADSFGVALETFRDMWGFDPEAHPEPLAAAAWILPLVALAHALGRRGDFVERVASWHPLASGAFAALVFYGFILLGDVPVQQFIYFQF